MPKAETKDEVAPETLTVVLRDDNDQSVYDVSQLAFRLGATQVEHSKGKLTVECPLGSDRNPASAREHLAAGLDADPLVVEVTS